MFETLEPRVLLSGDPITLAAQNALLAGLQSFESWTASQLNQAAQLVQQLPVVSSSVGDLVNLPGELQTHLVQPVQAYFASTSAPTIEGLAAALSTDPAEAGTVLGQFAHGEFLVTLTNFQTSAPISMPLNLTEDSTGISLQIATPPSLSGQASVSMALTFGYDTGSMTGATPGFFIQPTTTPIAESVALSATGFASAATLGAADATVTGGAAALSAAATVQLKDPVAGDTYNYITPTEFTATPLASLVSTSLSGTASLTLPISSSLVAGGPQSLQLNWSGNLASVGNSNLGSLGAWAQLDTISPALVQQAIAALPGLIQSATGSAGFGASVPVLGASVPVLGQDLGQLFNFGTEFSDAASAVSSATSLGQVATALQTHLGGTVTFIVNTANNELDMLVTASKAFDTTVPFAIDTQLAGANFVLNGSLHATGTATATIDLGLSFDTSKTDSNRLMLIESGSSLGLAFDAVTASSITATAALGLIRVQVNGGSIAVGALNGGAADPTHPATVTVGFVSTTGGRVTLAQLAANPTASLAAPVYTGAVQATLPLVGADGVTTAQVGMLWNLSQPVSASNPNVTGSSQAAALNVAPSSLLTATQLGTTAVSGLQLLGQWASTITTAAGQTGALATTLPLLGADLSQLSGLPAVLGAVASAIQSYAVAGANTGDFASAINSALAAFDAANPGFTLTATQLYAGLIPAVNAPAAESFGLTPGMDQLLFNLALTAVYAGTQAISLAGGSSEDNVTFSGSVPYTSTLNLGLTFGVSLAQNLGPADAAFVRLNQLDVQVKVAATGLSFAASVGVLGAQVTNGTITLTAQAGAVLPGGGTDGAQPQTISIILGTNVADLLSVAVEASMLSATMPVTSSFGNLASASAQIVLAGDPLSGAAPTVTITGANATNFNAFANLTPTDLLGALDAIGSTLSGIGNSSLLAAQIPLTNLTVGQAADFGAVYASDVTGPLSDNSGNPNFTSLQQFIQELDALSGLSAITTTYTSGSNQLDVGFTLAESFAATPATFNYDLTSSSGTILGDLSDVVATTASLSVSGTGTVSVAFGFNLSPSAVQVQGGTVLPATGVLPVGADAHFDLSLSAQGSNPTVVPVTVSAAATQGNTSVASLVADINAALQKALEAAGLDANLVTAGSTYISGGQALVLSLTAGAFTSMNVISTPQDPAVYGLGLAPSQTPTATLLGTAALPTNGKLSADVTFTVTADGGTATPITITAASTSANTSANQLLTQVQNALTPLNTALKAADRQPIVITLTSSNILSFAISGYGSTLQITAPLAAQIGLGLPAVQSVEAGAPLVSVEASAAAVPSNFVLTQDQTFSITVDGRSTFPVTITAASTAANTTAQNLADEITTALKAVNADLAGAGLPGVLVQIDSNGRLLFITNGSASSIVVQAAVGNQLGIGTKDASAASTLALVGSQDFANQVSLTTLQLGATMALIGSLTGTAQFGIVDIGFGPASVAIDPTVALSLSGTASLNSLLANPADIASYFPSGATLGGTASLTLPVSVSGTLGTELGLDTNAALTLNASNIFHLGSWTADPTDLEGLASLQSFSFANAQAAVTQLGSFISAFASNGLLGEKVPLIDVSLGSALGITQDFANIATDLQQGTNFTLDQLQANLDAAIGEAFGMSTTGNYVTLSLSNGILKLSLSFTPTLASTSLPMNFDLSALHVSGGSNIPGVTDFTGSNVTVTPSASFNLVLDIDLTTPASPVVDLNSATTLVLGLLISDPGLASASLSMGPMGLFITGGSLALSAAGNTSQPASFSISLSNAQARYNLQNLTNGSSGWFGGSSPINATINGQVTVSLPIAGPTVSTALGTLSLSIPNLGHFASDLLLNQGNLTNDVTFSVPNLSSTFSSIDLLGNDQGIIGALDTYLGTLQSLLNTKLFGLDIPLVGNALQSAGNFIGQLKSQIDAMGAAAGMQQVQAALFAALGPSGANLLQPGSGETTATLQDVLIEFETTGSSTFTTYNGSNAPSAQAIQDIQFVLNLGGDYTPSVPINFNLGLPGLGLSVNNGAINVDLLWTLALDFGIDRSSGLYIKTPGTGTDLSVELKAALSTGAQLTAQLGFLAVTATQPDPTKVDPITGTQALPTQIDLRFAAGFTGGSQMVTLGSLGSSSLPGVTATFSGSASVDLDLALGFDITGGAVDKSYPNFVAQLLIGGTGQTPWTFSGSSLNQTAAPSVSLNDIQLDFGSFLNNYLGSVLGPVVSVLKPIEPILNFLNTQVPIINESLLAAVVQIFGGDAQNVSQFFQFLQGITQFASDFSGGGSNPLMIGLGSFNLDSFDLRQLPGSGGSAIPDTSSSAGYSQLVSDMQNSVGDLAFATQSAIDAQANSDSSTFASDMTSVGAGAITFPILDNPMSLVGLMFGQQVTLVHIQAPELIATANFQVDIPVYPFITANLDAKVGIDVRFAAGYDTYGLVQAAADIKAGNSSAIAGDLAAGFYIDDTKQSDGNPATYVGILGGISVGASVGLGGLLSAGVSGGITLGIGVSLKDSAPADYGTAAYHKANDNDGKTRISEFTAWISEFGNPLCAFNLDGSVNFDLYAEE